MEEEERQDSTFTEDFTEVFSVCVKSHPCCLPQFPFLSVEDEHVNLTQNSLGSGIKEQRSSQAGAASSQEGISSWKKGQELDLALLWAGGMFVPEQQHRGLSSALQHGVME